MQVVLHTGAHFTDESKLVKSLDKNTDRLGDHGVLIPKPRDYRRQIRNALDGMDQGGMGHGQLARILDDMLGDTDPDRVILSNSNFFCLAPDAVQDNFLYPGAERRLALFANLFAGHEIEVLMAIRNPATFLPTLAGHLGDGAAQALSATMVPMALRWSELVLRIRTALPHVPLIIWCNEDTPLLWEELLREMAGLDPTVPLDGRNDLLADIMSDEGLERFEAYVADRPGLTEIQKRRVIAAFLDKFALDEEVEEELDMPGWTEDLIDALTEAYDEDVYQIERIPGVTLITP